MESILRAQVESSVKHNADLMQRLEITQSQLEVMTERY